MSDDVKSVLELKPDASGMPPPTPRPASVAARRVRWSLMAFLLGAATLVGTVILAPFAIYAGGDLIKSNDALVVLCLVLILAGVVCLLVSIVCGCLALKHHRVVLWWVVPSVLAVGFIGLLVVSTLAAI